MTVSLSLGPAKIGQVICPQAPHMAEELHPVHMFTKVAFIGILSSEFSEENSHVYFTWYFLSHSVKSGFGKLL